MSEFYGEWSGDEEVKQESNNIKIKTKTNSIKTTMSKNNLIKINK